MDPHPHQAWPPGVRHCI